MKQTIVTCLFWLVVGTITASAASTQAFEGEISDSQCGFNVHSRGRTHDEMIKSGTMGKTSAECAKNCVRGYGGEFVFVSTDRKNAYKLEPQGAAEQFVGQRVRIDGTLTKGTLHVTSIKPLP
jgi:Protein of unknown function (DUF5818)